MMSTILKAIQYARDFKSHNLKFSAASKFDTSDGQAWRYTLKRGNKVIFVAENEGCGGPSYITQANKEELKWLKETGLVRKALGEWKYNGNSIFTEEQLSNPTSDLIADAMADYEDLLRMIKSIKRSAAKGVMFVDENAVDTSYRIYKCTPTPEEIAKVKAKYPESIIVNLLLDEV